jgi:hypothetical protein
MAACIIIPSHIYNIGRSKLLMRCLNSLIKQTIQIPIYLSISFETDLDKILFNKKIQNTDFINNTLLHIDYRNSPTSQFRHIEYVIDNIDTTYKYVMFCDDDDTYNRTRVEKFINAITESEKFITESEKLYQKDCPAKFVGVYESSNINEYWAYCVNIKYIKKFINTLKINEYDYKIDHRMCDMLFVGYLKHLNHSNTHIFNIIDGKLYNYYKHSNSITGNIKKNNSNNRVQKITNNFDLRKSIKQYIKNGNILLLCIEYKCSFDYILEKILGEAVKYKHQIEKTVLSKLEYEYNDIVQLCDILNIHRYTDTLKLSMVEYNNMKQLCHILNIDMNNGTKQLCDLLNIDLNNDLKQLYDILNIDLKMV